MSYEGNSEIYRIDPSDGRVEARLTSNPAIDSSPSFSPDGSQIAFVSNRQGSPQIFVMSANGGAAKRVTFQGKYNQTPRWSPRPRSRTSRSPDATSGACSTCSCWTSAAARSTA